MERDSIKGEYDALIATIKDLLDILAKEKRVLKIITDELRELQKKYGNVRRTQIVPAEGEISIEDLIANEGCIITITHNGFIKRTAVSALSRPAPRVAKVSSAWWPARRRTKKTAISSSNSIPRPRTDYLMFFTQDGRCYVERVFEIPGRLKRIQRPQYGELPGIA